MTTKHVVNDEALGRIFRKQMEIYRRVFEGTLDPEGVCRNLQLVIEDAIPEDHCEEFTIGVRKGISYIERIQAGNYDCVHPDISCDDLLRSYDGSLVFQDTQKVLLVCWKEKLTFEQLSEELSLRGLRHSNFHEFFAFGAQFPNIQRRYPIITLAGTLRAPDWDLNPTRHLAPCLKEEKGRRILGFELLGENHTPAGLRCLVAEK